jgi:hypothetical protein
VITAVDRSANLSCSSARRPGLDREADVDVRKPGKTARAMGRWKNLSGKKILAVARAEEVSEALGAAAAAAVGRSGSAGVFRWTPEYRDNRSL